MASFGSDLLVVFNNDLLLNTLFLTDLLTMIIGFFYFREGIT